MEHQDLSQEKSRWLECDPVTLVVAAREQLYADGGNSGDTPQAAGPIEEVFSRFEHLTRATIGTASFATPSSGSRSGSR